MSNIKDVARVAGVSITTVSRVLNNTNYISAETKKKVYDAIHELDYHPHQIARALSKKQSFIIGLILPDSSHPFFAQLAKAIEKTAELSEYKVLLCNSLNDKEKETKYIKMLRENRADGIIMGSHALNTKEYEKIQYPVVTFDRTIGEIPCIS
ncbi:MAG: LacI family DNA-binding transcriptional regulator, partial [Vallitaleaceae bacterium]|nr:LacI family DNA-binding transcriptional regulator [Vallitaleaceae bacterium]